jgi:hypothetical protein
MNMIENIALRINEISPALTDIQWEPFRQDAVFVFSDNGNKKLVLQLTGIHFLATRQSLLGGPIMNYPEERIVEYLGIFDYSAFLRQFIHGGIQHYGQIILYDTHGRKVENPQFTKPLHVNIICSDGMLDVVCENVQLDDEEI